MFNIIPIKDYFYIKKNRKKIIKELDEKIEKIGGTEPIYNVLNHKENNNYREEMILSHRKLWYWIAYLILLTKNKKIRKSYYFDFYRINTEDRPISNCFCCHYTRSSYDSNYCNNCPLIFKNLNGDECMCGEAKDWHKYKSYSYISLFEIDSSWESKFFYAYKIAELEERK